MLSSWAGNLGMRARFAENCASLSEKGLTVKEQLYLSPTGNYDTLGRSDEKHRIECKGVNVLESTISSVIYLMLILFMLIEKFLGVFSVKKRYEF